MIYLVLASLLLIFLYVLSACVLQMKIPASISSTFYVLKHRWLFCSTMVLGGMLLLPAILECSKEGTEFLAYLAVIGLILVGFSPDYKGRDHIAHITGAWMTLLLSQIWVALNQPIVLTVWVAFLAHTICGISKFKEGVFVYKFKKTKPMFWVEIYALISTFISVLSLI